MFRFFIFFFCFLMLGLGGCATVRYADGTTVCYPAGICEDEDLVRSPGEANQKLFIKNSSDLCVMSLEIYSEGDPYNRFVMEEIVTGAGEEKFLSLWLEPGTYRFKASWEDGYEERGSVWGKFTVVMEGGEHSLRPTVPYMCTADSRRGWWYRNRRR